MFAILKIKTNEFESAFVKENETPLQFDDVKKTKSYAKKNCSFEYEIIELPEKR